MNKKLNLPPSIYTKAGKRQLIRNLHKSMLKSFQNDVAKLPPGWSGVEIKTWMAERWARESLKHMMVNGRSTKPYRTFLSICYERGV